MKLSYYKLMSITAIVVFIGYWIIIPLLSVPHIPAQKQMNAKFSTISKWFAFNWQFFSKPITYNDRMYIITRHTNETAKSDTFEVLQKISLDKQSAAPFNQKENILDHFAAYYVTDIKRVIYRNKNSLQKKYPTETNSFYISQSIKKAGENNAITPAVIALYNFSKQEIRNQLKDTINLEFKYILADQSLPPFAHRANKNSNSAENIF